MINRKPIVCYLTVLCLCMLSLCSSAQDKAKHTFGKLLPGDFALPSSKIIDSNASAVILYDIGDVHYVGNKEGWFSYVYKRQTRIRILNKKGLEYATVDIPLRGGSDHPEVLSRIEAITYNLENGQLVQTKLDPKDVYIDKPNKYWIRAKFSMPSVRAGSIIEYTYTVTSEWFDRLPTWRFQWQGIPCLWSEYLVDIPQTLSFVFVRQGIHPYAVDKGSTGHDSYRVTETNQSGIATTNEDLTVSANTVRHDWAIKDIPAFGDETYLTTPENYMDQISFQLSGTYTGEETFAHTNTWAKATDELLEKSNFGAPLNEENDEVAALTDKITPNDGDQLTRAKAIYYYFSHHFTCTDENWPYIETSLRDVIKHNSGTVGDINLLLIAVLRRLGIQADPVLLSTRAHGYNLITYPVLDKMNYVIARVRIDGVVYYLDATHPQLGFGDLAGDCYNGYARIISQKDSGSVRFEADSLKESRFTMVLLSPDARGLTGSWESTMGKQESLTLRRAVAKKGVEQYFRDIQTSYGDDLAISNGGIDSLDQPEFPVKLHYDFLLREPADASVIYLNPMIGDAKLFNPFDADERKYPIEMPYTRDDTYVFSMPIPDGYVVDELPKSTKVAFNGDQGYFEYMIGSQDGQIQLRCRLRLNKAWFPAEDYGTLRQFYGFVVKKENEQVVLKKK